MIDCLWVERQKVIEIFKRKWAETCICLYVVCQRRERCRQSCSEKKIQSNNSVEKMVSKSAQKLQNMWHDMVLENVEETGNVACVGLIIVANNSNNSNNE